MIEKLKLKDAKEAAKIYNKGLQIEIPKGDAALNETVKHLKEVHTFVYKQNQTIKGLISFIPQDENKIKIDFICVVISRKGIGKKLIKKLADFSIKRGIKFIYSNVSSKDQRAMSFYENLGFRKYGKHFVRKNFMLYRIRAKPEWIKKAIKRRT